MFQFSNYIFLILVFISCSSSSRLNISIEKLEMSPYYSQNSIYIEGIELGQRKTPVKINDITYYEKNYISISGNVEPWFDFNDDSINIYRGRSIRDTVNIDTVYSEELVGTINSFEFNYSLQIENKNQVLIFSWIDFVPIIIDIGKIYKSQN